MLWLFCWRGRFTPDVAAPTRVNQTIALYRLVPSEGECRVFPWATDETCNLDASVVRPQHVKHLGIVPHLQAVG
jgi:hypothetical protein